MSIEKRSRLPGPQRRAQLLAAARDQFVARGYASTRIQDVAEDCGITEAAVYRHFNSKEELFDAAIMQPLQETLAQQVRDIRAMPVDPRAEAQEQTTREFMRALLRTFIGSVEEIGVVLFGDRDHATAFYKAHVLPVVDAVIAASEATLSTWPHREYDISIAAHSVFGMAFWLAIHRTLAAPHDDIDRTADQLADIFFNGIRARA